MKLANLVKSKYFCYFTYALMVINLLGYVSTGSMECVVIFALATFACKSCLSTNMCLCIFGGLFVSNIIFGCSKVKEGMLNDAKTGCTEPDNEEFSPGVAASCKLKEAETALDELLSKKDCDDGGGVWTLNDGEVEGGEGTCGGVKEKFRNRRNRRKAVREAFSTIHRAVRSY